MKQEFLAVVLTCCSLVLATQTFAQEESESTDLLELCQRFPQNSKCDGVEAPISLEERAGVEVECQLRFGGNDEIEACKYFVEGDTLTVYVEVGEQTEILDGLQPTKEIKITSENLLFFPTVINYKWQTKFDTQLQLLLRSDYDIFFKVDDDEQSDTRSNRISIYFRNFLRNPKKEQEQDLLSFLQSDQSFNTDQQKINLELNNLQSPAVNLSRSQAIQQLLEEKSCVRCDLSGADLTEADLENANLEGANLDNAILTNANLDKAYLLGASLKSAMLDGASLTSAELPYGSLAGANLQSANLAATNLIGTNFTDANLANANLKDFTNLETANLTNANLEGAKIEGINLNQTNLTSANLKNATIAANAIVKRNTAFIQKSTLIKANLTNADLTNVLAEGVVFDRANLSDAIFVGANLSPSKVGKNELVNLFRETQLTNADLSNSLLEKANFSRANLEGANLTNTNIESAVLCKTILPDGSVSEASCEDEKEP